MEDADQNFNRDPNLMEIGHEPMTDAQRIELELLSGQAGEPMSSDQLTRAQATEIIEALRQRVDEESGTGVREDDTDTVIGDDD